MCDLRAQDLSICRGGVEKHRVVIQGFLGAILGPAPTAGVTRHGLTGWAKLRVTPRTLWGGLVEHSVSKVERIPKVDHSFTPRVAGLRPHTRSRDPNLLATPHPGTNPEPGGRRLDSPPQWGGVVCV